MLNVTHLAPRKRPPFPWDEEVMVEMAKRMRLAEERDEDDGERGPKISEGPPTLMGWEIRIDADVNAIGDAADEKLEACAMGMGGKTIVGLGSRGSMWTWTARSLGF
jgi:hypothetical protein